MKRELSVTDIDDMLRQALKGMQKSDPSGHRFTPNDAFWFNGDANGEEPAYIRHGSGVILRVEPGAQQVLAILAARVREQLLLPEQGDEPLIMKEVAYGLGDVIVGRCKLKGLGARLLEDLGKRWARSVTVFAVAGLNLPGNKDDEFSIKWGDNAVMGTPMDVEGVISDFAMDFVGHRMELGIGAWWCEESLAYRSEPELFEEGPPSMGISVVAIGTDAIGYGAAIRAKEQIEALLGALWLVNQKLTSWPVLPPWILGGPSRSETPRDPSLNEDDALSMVGIQVSTRSHATEEMVFEGAHPSIDVRQAFSAAAGLFGLLAKAESRLPERDLASRLAAACRFALAAAQDTSEDLRLLHLVVALEALVSDHSEGAGVTSRFKARLLALVNRLPSDHHKLEALYALRSEVGHQGFSASARSRLVKATRYAHELLGEAIDGFVKAVETYGFRSSSDLLAWLDRSSPDVSDPFA